MKVDLLPKKQTGSWRNPDSSEIHLKRCLPFYKSQHGSYVHRIRSAYHILWKGEYGHTVIHLWCGMSGFFSKKRDSKLLSDLGPDSILCATCEGRAIGAGQLETHQIAGRFVKFSPRL